jgi:UMF1 family MFS transporter
VLFVISTAAPSAGGGLFETVPEKVFVGLGLLIGAVAGPLQASSRAHLARVVPAEDAGRYFGLLALSGKVTSFLAPLTVAVATQAAGTQAAGPAVLILFFGAGAGLIASLRRS